MWVRFNATMALSNESTKNPVSLKEVRQKLNLTQEDVAKVLGTKRPHISDIERGVKVPDWLGKAIALNRLLTQAGYTYDDLIFTLPDPQPDDHGQQ